MLGFDTAYARFQREFLEVMMKTRRVLCPTLPNNSTLNRRLRKASYRGSCYVSTLHPSIVDCCLQTEGTGKIDCFVQTEDTIKKTSKVPTEKCMKVVVAVQTEECPRLQSHEPTKDTMECESECPLAMGVGSEDWL
ncbi:uncharacterized protein [Dermacentor andersoni]|uniref:uncharacterized protein isoform X19 n=1 Tax=Dermacentor andersoni TaxID=34620 RepID=UPI003B3AB348